MMNLENCRNELLAQGIETEEITVMKNGVKCSGIRIINSTGNISPVVYYSETDTMDEFMRRIASALSTKTPLVDTRKLQDWDYIRRNLYLSVQRKSSEDIVKRQHLNLDLIMRVYMELDNCTGTVKVTRSLIEMTGVAENDFWEAAVENSRNRYHITGMAEILGMDSLDNGMYVVTSDDMMDGAGALYFSEIFTEFCREKGEKSCYILPSSTQEVIVLPGSKVDGSDLDAEELAEMVRNINAEQVDPIIQLDPVVYRCNSDSGEIVIVADSGKERLS